MILADAAVGSHELIDRINKRGVPCEKDRLPFADFMFEGNTDKGRSMIGIERKKIRDLMDCINTVRYAGFQHKGMARWYRFRFLLLEGIWKADNQSLNLMHVEGNKLKFYMNGNYYVRHSKLFNFLISTQINGNYLIRTTDDTQTVIAITELYKYFQKPWDGHTSFKQVYMPPIASFSEPSLLLQFLSTLSGLGVKYASLAEKHFSSRGGSQAERIQLALKADELEWLKIEGLSPKTAKRIVKELNK